MVAHAGQALRAPAAVAVFDVGKSNLKLLAVDASGRILGQRTTPNRSVDGSPYLHVDVEAVERWLLAGLGELAASHRIGTVVTTAHGSGGVLVADDGPVLPMVDYEARPPDWLDEAYTSVMPPFPERGSRLLGGAGHLGRQLFWQSRQWPGETARARAILALPQYWAWRLSGVMASEYTSLAAQSHLWDVPGDRPSSLVERMGWARLLPPLRPAWERLGPLLPRIAAATGLAPDTMVVNGIHDSSANLHRYARAGLGDATLLSTGTWIVGLRAGLAPDRLVERRGMTLNADIRGRPVGGVLAMLGREMELIAGGVPAGATEDELGRAVAVGAMALPSFVPFEGMFPGTAGCGRIVGGEAAPRAVALLYGALVADACLSLLGDSGTAVLDGGLAAEPRLAGLLATLRPDLGILVEPVGGGTALGAALLADMAAPAPELRLRRAAALDLAGLRGYRDHWHRVLSADTAGEGGGD
ncbi:MAG TPA: FGGY family carbohydrate kinase [Geminicoccaceae bacterium]|nr:FGGY family carbohydrate kinase [Geminicoccaceae bacterium]